MKVLIADDHPLYREAAATQVRRLYRDAQVDEVSSLEELRATTARSSVPYGLILVDYYMPGMTSQALADLVTDLPEVPLAVMSGTARNIDVRAAIQAGIRVYIPKTSSSEYFAHALQMLLAGGSCIPSEILLDQSAAPGEVWLSQMSEREQQVLKGVALGQSNKEIGRTLGLAEVTIKLHLRNVFRKMDVKSRSEAAVKAVRAGLS
ncbi:MAG: response regulator transcription factor [Alphaproteobacteria bacterium]|nr:response regulator transcription factor [Alphaproteobacteria bacterium]